MKILDIGCGKNKYRSKRSNDIVIGIDSVKLPGVDKVVNLEKFPWPFKKDEFDIVVSNHVLEHLSDLIRTMEEIHRISKPGAIVRANIPYFASSGAFQDPTHKRFFTYRTFEYFTEESGFNFYTKARFKINKRKMTFMVTRPNISKMFDPFMNYFPRFYERFFSRILPAEQLFVELVVLK
jgi:predicted SAM-dependent methyltransferase